MADELPAPLYTVEGVYPVPVEALWTAWTDAAELERWYSPTDLSVTPGSAVSDARPGGRWAIGVDVPAHGFTAWFWGRYTEVVPHRRLVHTLSYSQDRADFDAHDDDAPAHVIVVDFEERGAESLVRFAQIGEMPAEQVEATRAGMQSYFDSLQRHLAASA